MSLAFSVLGSGSSGNSTVLLFQTDHRHRYVLIDAGFSPRQTTKRLLTLGIELDDVEAIVLTHLDRDHFHHGWIKAAARRGMIVHTHRRHRNELLRTGLSPRSINVFEHELNLPGGATIRAVHLAHDRLGTCGFVIEHHGLRLGWATDLGRVPSALFDHFFDLHALGFESNYDPVMQQASDRPDFLKRRIMGGAGHLSNQQSLKAIQRIAEASSLNHIALLHLSRHCNDRKMIQRLYQCGAVRLEEMLARRHVEFDGGHAGAILPSVVLLFHQQIQPSQPPRRIVIVLAVIRQILLQTHQRQTAFVTDEYTG